MGIFFLPFHFHLSFCTILNQGKRPQKDGWHNTECIQFWRKMVISHLIYLVSFELFNQKRIYTIYRFGMIFKFIFAQILLLVLSNWSEMSLKISRNRCKWREISKLDGQCIKWENVRKSLCQKKLKMSTTS